MYTASKDLEAAKLLPQDEAIKAMIRAAEEKLNTSIGLGDNHASSLQTSSLVEERGPEAPLTTAHIDECTNHVSNGLQEPVFQAEVVDKGNGPHLVLVVNLPGVNAFKELSLELSSTNVRLSGCGYHLATELPIVVDSDKTVAKFSQKSQTLKITAPKL